MTTPKQQKYINYLRYRLGPDDYRQVMRKLGFSNRKLAELSTRDASRLIDALKHYPAEKTNRQYTFAMNVYAVQGQILKLKPSRRSRRPRPQKRGKLLP